MIEANKTRQLKQVKLGLSNTAEIADNKMRPKWTIRKKSTTRPKQYYPLTQKRASVTLECVNRCTNVPMRYRLTGASVLEQGALLGGVITHCSFPNNFLKSRMNALNPMSEENPVYLEIRKVRRRNGKWHGLVRSKIYDNPFF